MMPAFFPEDAPPGEQAVYQALATGDTDGWQVLHSLAIANHVKNPEGEADFVVIAPSLGILVIEVKSHHTIHFDADNPRGEWQLGSHARTKRGPFQQAREAFFSIRNALQKNFDVGAIPMVYAVWFTGVPARRQLPETPEWSRWQVMDSEDLQRDPIGAVRRTLKLGRAHLADKFGHHAFQNHEPDRAAAQRLAGFLRPNFDVGILTGARRGAREAQLVHFLDEQYEALDAMLDNPSVLFTGPAGSGKTLLAMEAARRESEQGNRGRLICFNSLLGRRIASDMASVQGVEVGTLHRQLLALTGAVVPDEAVAAFWARALPELALEMLLDRKDEEKDDFLVIDEVQDLLTEPYLDVFDQMVKGGLTRGRVLMFGDFERQAIFDDGSGRALLRRRLPSLPTSRLLFNCRNLPAIGTTVNVFSGLTPGYSRYRRQDDGARPRLLSYRYGTDQTPHLRKAIEELRDEHFELSEVVVLSPLAEGSVASTTSDEWLRKVLKRADGRAPKKGELRYASIQEFKGLETPAVVVTDLNRSVIPNFESVMYVGLTRATDRLYGIIEESTGRAVVEGSL